MCLLHFLPVKTKILQNDDLIWYLPHSLFVTQVQPMFSMNDRTTLLDLQCREQTGLWSDVLTTPSQKARDFENVCLSFHSFPRSFSLELIWLRDRLSDEERQWKETTSFYMAHAFMPQWSILILVLQIIWQRLFSFEASVKQHSTRVVAFGRSSTCFSFKVTHLKVFLLF